MLSRLDQSRIYQLPILPGMIHFCIAYYFQNGSTGHYLSAVLLIAVLHGLQLSSWHNYLKFKQCNDRLIACSNIHIIPNTAVLVLQFFIGTPTTSPVPTTSPTIKHFSTYSYYCTHSYIYFREDF